MLKLFKKVISLYNAVFNYIILKHKKIQYGKNLRIIGRVYFHGFGKIIIGDNVDIISSSYCNATAGGIEAHLSTGNSGTIIIGNNVGISHIALTAYKNITICDNVLIGSNCMIADTDFHSLDADKRILDNNNSVAIKPILIKKNVFIGARSIVLKGVTIGENSIVGAGSVVTSSIPDNEIWAGNPARFIRKC